MAILLELSPEQEERLRDAAEAKGLSVEGYLLTLVEVIVQPQTSHARPPAYARAMARLFQRGADSAADLSNPEGEFALRFDTSI